MKKLAVLLTLGLLGAGLAQGVRSLGMGGVALPGPSFAGSNPAYAAFPDTWGREGFALPVGLLRFLPAFSDTSPFTYFTDPNAFRTSFDLLSFYDQASHLGSFLLNPARSPDEVVFRVKADGLAITDGRGNPLLPSFQVGGTPEKPTALIPAPLFSLGMDLGPGTYLSVGPFAGTQGVRVRPSPELAQALVGGSIDPCKASTPSPCHLEAGGAFASGISLALGFATPLPEVPGLGRVYLGVRGEGFYGLGYVEASGLARPTFDPDGNVNGVSYETRYFLSYPEYLESSLGLGGSGLGYGVRADLGVAVDGGQYAFGLGVRNLLGFSQWSGVEVEVKDGHETRTPTTRRSGFSAPAFFLNGAYRLPLDVGELLLAADASFGATAPAFRLGLEYALGPVALRTGLGLEGGFRFGLGAGLNLEAMTLDLALTTHQAPLVGGTVYGLALAVGF
ncbi:hypothetical protein [Thermus tengchongensis]|uniref:DUF5723 domain-containing protein n=1 Tax=Thermus tengchongensis TaxID=1214928 RepID=A0A4Y9EYS4_9DEIN|nr:hypothetical protein [Thermus tengchongensis]TFU17681.1 hypothetical protein E0489_02585 [Thermus tengchongensis]TFU25980.1 hypothetical protein E0687_08035 [Thermus tengchongensis]